MSECKHMYQCVGNQETFESLKVRIAKLEEQNTEYDANCRAILFDILNKQFDFGNWTRNLTRLVEKGDE